MENSLKPYEANEPKNITALVTTKVTEVENRQKVVFESTEETVTGAPNTQGHGFERVITLTDLEPFMKYMISVNVGESRDGVLYDSVGVYDYSNTITFTPTKSEVTIYVPIVANPMF